MGSECMRQQLLDHLQNHPSSTPREIWTALGQRVELTTVSRCLTEMVRYGECHRTQDLLERGAPFRYTAVAVVVRPSNPRGAPPLAARKEPGRYVHNNKQRRPIQNQGGQGGLFGFFRINPILGE